jgi:hypothetical protein
MNRDWIDDYDNIWLGNVDDSVDYDSEEDDSVDYDSEEDDKLYLKDDDNPFDDDGYEYDYKAKKIYEYSVNVLSKLDMSHIERYIREKKLENINRKNAT